MYIEKENKREKKDTIPGVGRRFRAGVTLCPRVIPEEETRSPRFSSEKIERFIFESKENAFANDFAP